ncbi:unnamed protein product [Prorocentrum cordatum]|uniref:Uncharacterized protein n=1 Tax=Prorocentrum cordatum TaxID=2364126 RepID=A0ABN9V453_9DINO|nr:unnamed protein product [Polarella glacialis]
MDLMGSHRMINHSDSESIGSRIESSSGFGDESSSALSHEVLPWHGQSVVAGQPAEGPHVFLADSASNGDSSVQESGFEESSVQSSALDNQGSPPLCERDGCVMQISDLFPDIGGRHCSLAPNSTRLSWTQDWRPCSLGLSWRSHAPILGSGLAGPGLVCSQHPPRISSA